MNKTQREQGKSVQYFKTHSYVTARLKSSPTGEKLFNKLNLTCIRKPYLHFSVAGKTTQYIHDLWHSNGQCFLKRREHFRFATTNWDSLDTNLGMIRITWSLSLPSGTFADRHAGRQTFFIYPQYFDQFYVRNCFSQRVSIKKSRNQYMNININ